ncbi:Na/Pi cotransporter family protein [Desulfobacula sp.]|uniref:Na/Pi cotransporter family protein n=1 Tax=Desulfobacula sp. TaxID=2593537 RepID=UPI0025BBA29D|nr:Na/Pi cotransporter family protein [Desulfobacula sp.]MBC2702937.1 Na/Pi cotransporter family protein [Desulfobacula sp.]
MKITPENIKSGNYKNRPIPDGFLSRRLVIKATAGIALLWFLPVSIAGAGAAGPGDFSWTDIFIGLAGGLAFFLYGMEKMSNGMKTTAGNKMRSILASLTRNRFIALIVGAFVTMVIQSSSATTVMLVSFVQAGLLNLAQSMGVILGADIGTTITAQMIAFKLTDYALLMVAIGFLIKMFGKTEKIKSVGDILLGFGILFFGMKLMSDVMKPLRTYPAFIDLMKDLETPFMGIVFGAAFTAIVQSSSATTGVLIVLAQQGLITLEGGIPVIFGANIGTCVTAALAGIGASREAKRVAIAHIMFKLAGVCLFIFWIPQFADLIRALADKFNSGTARQLANAHTLFNVSLGLFFLPFISFFSKIIYFIYPKKIKPKSQELATWYIEEAMLETPSLAIDLARAEIARIAKILGRMLDAIIIPFLSDEKYMLRQLGAGEDVQLLLKEIPKRDAVFPDLTLLQGLDMRERKIDFLEEKISAYLTHIAQGNITKEQAEEAFGMVSIVKDMESMGDIIHRNMVPLIAKKKQLKFDFSFAGKEELLIYHGKVSKQIRFLEAAFKETNPKLAFHIMKKERKYLDLESKYRARHLKRIVLKNEESIATTEIHLELMDLMKQVLLYSANIAKTYAGATPENGEKHVVLEKKQEESKSA